MVSRFAFSFRFKASVCTWKSIPLISFFNKNGRVKCSSKIYQMFQYGGAVHEHVHEINPYVTKVSHDYVTMVSAYVLLSSSENKEKRISCRSNNFSSPDLRKKNNRMNYLDSFTRISLLEALIILLIVRLYLVAIISSTR